MTDDLKVKVEVTHTQFRKMQRLYSREKERLKQNTTEGGNDANALGEVLEQCVGKFGASPDAPRTAPRARFVRILDLDD